MSELRITFLGTGSGRPTPRRGSAAVYLQYAGQSILFDCGEGTQLQLLRAGVRTSRLLAVCVTHFHGDHVNGLPGFLGTMGLNGHRDPLDVIGPPGLDRYFAVLRDLAILRPAFPLRVGRADVDGPVLSGEGWDVFACPLDHRVPTWGFQFVEHDHVGRFDVARARELGVTPGPDFGRLQRGESLTLEDGREITPEQVLGPSRPGRRVAYISDTRPSDDVIRFVAGADVLVHEATYLDELRDQARERGHSTVAEAAAIARDAGVRRLILTHISPKHVRSKEILREARDVFDNVELAEDLKEFELDVPA